MQLCLRSLVMIEDDDGGGLFAKLSHRILLEREVDEQDVLVLAVVWKLERGSVSSGYVLHIIGPGFPDGKSRSKAVVAAAVIHANVRFPRHYRTSASAASG